ncbi:MULTISPECIES: hypothetical protein [Halobacteriaceae]|uniref:Uncharacterized protein n=1 Tax=Halanaeroarchaeum sulfurireducens TaxID=1604004 RepID=A0A0F7PDA6_9EURY|nr:MULTISPECIES: hypothetical protein [Halobacteriaceae]AKH98672.1 hypothetical protein HLASF_3046 [Halanaeroarchaeum sulfurireducens]MDR5657838.1 hypothetical protein [Halodesulfurarchaeum sp. HSR-GB]
MTQHNVLSRRTALRTVAGAALVSVAGCLNKDGGSGTPGDGTTSPGGQGPLEPVAVEGTTLVVELSADADVSQVNLIQPNGELFGQRDVAAGAQQVSFEIGTAYAPGEYRVVALKGEETIAESSTEIQPEIQMQDVGLFRNNPDKPWDEVYGDTETDRLKNGEAFVTVTNTGTGPEAIVELVFAGDVPNPIENPQGNGMYDTEQVIVDPGETTDLFSNSFPFGSESEKGMGCSSEGNSGQFTVFVETRVGGDEVAKLFDVQYSGSDEMSDCEITITET